ncbi:MAG: hypothetical protein K1X46_04965 [Chitinophagaceae bacterium]|nr:hypothetical protein [Chitinophagaceae bacterium]
MVVDETKLKEDSTLEESFKLLRLLIAMSVFPENKVNLILTNDTFKPYKTYKDEGKNTMIEEDAIEPVATDTTTSK